MFVRIFCENPINWQKSVLLAGIAVFKNFARPHVPSVNAGDVFMEAPDSDRGRKARAFFKAYTEPGAVYSREGQWLNKHSEVREDENFGKFVRCLVEYRQHFNGFTDLLCFLMSEDFQEGHEYSYPVLGSLYQWHPR